jgi:hypothetical protein
MTKKIHAKAQRYAKVKFGLSLRFLCVSASLREKFNKDWFYRFVQISFALISFITY